MPLRTNSQSTRFDVSLPFLNAYNRTKSHGSIWSDFIPAEEYHVFQRGAYYSSEVIPDKLAVISLNTIYWYDANKGVFHRFDQVSTES